MRSANARENCKYSLIARCLSGSRTALSPQDYFGEKVALFYVFLCHYTTWCAYLAIAGFAMACDVFIEWSVDTMPVEFFAIFVAVWAVLLMEYWKQKEATMAMKWGMPKSPVTTRRRWPSRL